MANLIKLIIYFFIITTVVKAYNPARQTSKLNFALWSAHISPEILNELKDFENLIPATTIDEIVAKHFLIDGNFRTAFKYLRGEEFTQLQRQLLNLPEVLDILEFLHLTTANATTRHMGATTTELITTDAIKASSSYKHDDDNNAMPIVSTVNFAHNLNSIERTKGTFNNKKTVQKRPQTSVQLNSIDDDIASSFNVEQPLVRIVLLKDTVVQSSNSYDVAADNKDHHFNNHQQHSRKYRQRFSNNYHHHHEHYQSLGTFTAFVEEVLQHLPHVAYQNMIKDKCQKNAKFAVFYQALRSPEFKPLVEQSMQTSNIKNVIKTLNGHDVDVLALKPIAFQVISWGPNI